MSSLVEPTPTYCVSHPDVTYSVADQQHSMNIAQPQGEWVDLTDDDLVMLWHEDKENAISFREHETVANMAIAKFKEKNTPVQREQQEPVAWAFFFRDGSISSYFFNSQQKAYDWFTNDDWDGFIAPVYTPPPNLDQILHDPENQPSQYGTVPAEYVEAMRIETLEKAAQMVEDWDIDMADPRDVAAAIRGMK